MKKKHKVIVYSTTACPWCHKAKEFLNENKIDFVEVDVGENQERAKEMVEKSGQMGVPVIDIDGDVIVGFDKEKIKGLLGIK